MLPLSRSPLRNSKTAFFLSQRKLLFDCLAAVSLVFLLSGLLPSQTLKSLDFDWDKLQIGQREGI